MQYRLKVMAAFDNTINRHLFVDTSQHTNSSRVKNGRSLSTKHPTCGQMSLGSLHIATEEFFLLQLTPKVGHFT